MDKAACCVEGQHWISSSILKVSFWTSCKYSWISYIRLFLLFLIKYKHILTRLLRSRSFPFVWRVPNMLILPNGLCNLNRGFSFSLSINYCIISLCMYSIMQRSYQEGKHRWCHLIPSRKSLYCIQCVSCICWIMNYSTLVMLNN